MTMSWDELIVVIVIIITLYVQLAPTMTIETIGKMSNPMCSLTFFDNMIHQRVGAHNHPLLPFPDSII